MIILGIESSCDETAAAIVEDGIKIISNKVASSQELHKKTGGIIPEIAAREQIRSIIPVIEESLSVLGPNKGLKSLSLVDAIAVTTGPGLIGSLLVGIETAKTLSYVFKKPIVPVNHLKGHFYANWLEGEEPLFPLIGLLVSGGHTDLVLMENHNKINWLGGTKDDAAGECFDKTARLLDLGYPGGPAISASAKKASLSQKTLEKMLPRPMINQKNFDFSFSGLKTAVLNKTKEKKQIKKEDLAAAIQISIVDCLVKKTLFSLEKYKVKSLLVAGGVAANEHLKKEFEKKLSGSNVKLFISKPSLCTDNAAYIASCACFNYSPIPWQNLQANPSLAIEEVIK